MIFLSALLALRQGTMDDFASAWATVETSIRNRYYARDVREKEMNSLLNEYRPLASTTTTREAFSTVVNQMIRDFKDSHFSFITRADQAFYVMDALANAQMPAEAPHFGAWFRKTVDGYTVQMVLNGTEAERKDFRKGDVVLTVDQKPFSPIAALDEKVGKDVQLEVRRRDRVIQKSVHVDRGPLLEAFLNASRDSRRVIDRNGRKIGYFHLWTQAQEAFRNALSSAVYGPLSKTDAMILDLRDGFGGRPEGYADPFFRPEVAIESRLSDSLRVDQIFGYQRPLVVLINGGSRSAKEVLSFILKKSKRATLVGIPTAGNVLGTLPQKIGDWAYLEIPMTDMRVDGVRLENNGVKPDVAVPVEFDDEGHDLVLEAGLKILESVPKFRPSKMD